MQGASSSWSRFCFRIVDSLFGFFRRKHLIELDSCRRPFVRDASFGTNLVMTSNIDRNSFSAERSHCDYLHRPCFLCLRDQPRCCPCQKAAAEVSSKGSRYARSGLRDGFDCSHCFVYRHVKVRAMAIHRRRSALC